MEPIASAAQGRYEGQCMLYVQFGSVKKVGNKS